MNCRRGRALYLWPSLQTLHYLNAQSQSDTNSFFLDYIESLAIFILFELYIKM